MNPTMKVKKSDVRPILMASFPGYNGRKFQVEFTDAVWFSDTNWGGGSRTYYRFVNMDNGMNAALSVPAPWNNPYEGQRMELPENIVVVAHSIFCGQDMGITFYAHPSRSRMLEDK